MEVAREHFCAKLFYRFKVGLNQAQSLERFTSGFETALLFVPQCSIDSLNLKEDERHSRMKKGIGDDNSGD